MELFIFFVVGFVFSVSNAAFTGKDCLSSHNILRGRHKAQPLRYSKELEKSAQVYADKLALLDDDKNDP